MHGAQPGAPPLGYANSITPGPRRAAQQGAWRRTMRRGLAGTAAHRQRGGQLPAETRIWEAWRPRRIRPGVPLPGAPDAFVLDIGAGAARLLREHVRLSSPTQALTQPRP